MKKLLFATVLACFLAAPLGGCTDPAGTERLLTQQGYSAVETDGFALLDCWGRDDVYRTAFIATAPSGERVSGAVCQGWLKGKTVRFD